MKDKQFFLSDHKQLYLWESQVCADSFNPSIGNQNICILKCGLIINHNTGIFKSIHFNSFIAYTDNRSIILLCTELKSNKKKK